MDMCNLLTIFQNKSSCSIDIVKQRLKSYSEDGWIEKCIAMPKLRSYRLYKHEYKAESYVIMHLPKFERSLVAQLRAGILPLKLETGRFRNIKDMLSKIINRYLLSK